MSPPVQLAAFLELANLALAGLPVLNPQDFEPETKRGMRAYRQALHVNAEKLQGTSLWVDGDAGRTVSLFQTWAVPLREVLTGLLRAEPGQTVSVNVPIMMLDEAVVRSNGRVEIRSQPDGTFYRQFLKALERLDTSHLHECPVCQTLYWGRKDKQVCSGRCRVARFRQTQPDRYQDAQIRHEIKRAEKERLTSGKRERLNILDPKEGKNSP